MWPPATTHSTLPRSQPRRSTAAGEVRRGNQRCNESPFASILVHLKRIARNPNVGARHPAPADE